MKKDIILAGVGGQGILSIAAVIDRAALNNKLHFKQAEVHGMSQRGGDVQSHLRISSDIIYSDLISQGCADLILAVEPLEALRYLPFLSNSGWVVSALTPYNNIAYYPDDNSIRNALNKLPRKLLVEAEKIAREQGSSKTSNMVMLGAAAHLTGLSNASLEDAITWLFERKGEEIVSQNLAAFRAGLQAGTILN